jgi:two-component system CheB/CheR fusion protein
MPVEQAEDGARARPNRVYVIPPNAVLTLERGVLRVARPAETGLRTPVDAFFRSLAQDQGEAAVGIILSGTGTDGTSGLRAIKEHGGLTLAQAPETARYESMPESAIAAGLVDAALPVEEMPARLLSYARHLADIQRGEAEQLDAEVAARLPAVCASLQRHTGHDFSHYKEGTLVRRIGRRIRIQNSTSVVDYLQRLERDAGEAESLVRDLSIGVTHFFRDAEVFQALAKLCLPAMLDGGDPSAPARIWVPGCASGEEAYAIAILAREHLLRRQATRAVQIFATDIDSELVATARHGRYPGEIRQHVSPERLERFFASEDAAFRVVKELRDMCTFSVHSLIKDAPFSSLDLISCRNVLIYLGADLQKKLVPLFHFALRSGGYLLLGPSEDLAAHDELFTREDRPHRLFRRSDAVVRPPELPLTGRTVSRGTPHPLFPKPESLLQPPMLHQALERMIREEYAPPCVVINERGEILYLTGRTSRYLQAHEGAPTNNLFDQAHTRLRLELRTALAAAVNTRQSVVRRNVSVEPSDVGSAARQVTLTVRPLPGLPSDTGLYAVVLQEGEAGGDLEAEGEAEDASATERDRLIIAQLEVELRTTRADLQSSAEELETSNEELKSANEELISTNEELQSANEELQSSREELQTVNDELREKVQSLDLAQSDLQSHYASSQIATIFLDRDLRITRFTPAATALFRLIEGDRGRPIGDLAPRVRHEALLADAEAVLRTEQSVERHVRSADGARWFLMRLLPYRAQGGSVSGVGLTFVDVTGLMRAEEAERRYGQLLMLSPDAIFVWRLEGGIETWNRGAEELYGFSLEEARGKEAHALLHTRSPCPFSEIATALRERGRWDGDLVQQTKGGGTVTVSAKLKVERGDDGLERVFETNRDITERQKAEDELRASEQRLSKAQEIAHLGSWELDVVNNRLSWSDEVYRIFGLEPQAFAATYEAFLEVVHPDDRAAVDAAYSRSLREERDGYESEHRVVRKTTGEIRVVHERCDHLRETSGRIVRSVGMVHDITERKQTESRLAWLASFPERDPVPIAEIDLSGQVHYLNPAGRKAFPDLPEKQLAHPWLADWDTVVSELGAKSPHERVIEASDTYYHQVIASVPETGRIRIYGTDITNRKRAEQALEGSRQNLEEADKRKNEFLAMLSHELRNPLAPIRNSLYILDRAAPGGEQTKRAKAVIERQVVHLTRLVDDLLDVTRIARGKVQLRFDCLELGALLRRAVEDHRSTLGNAGLELAVRIAQKPLWVNGDATRLAQVVGNLLHNAAKFTNWGGHVQVALEEDPPRGMAVIRVNDDGAGIQPQLLPRLFQPFEQADRTLDRSRGGLGLGLAVVKSMTEQHGGEVQAHSDGPGKGAEFTIRLPLVASPAVRPATAISPLRTARRILVIEDNVDAADSLREALELAGHEVEVAYDGLDGLKKAREFKPEIVLCDIGLPEMDGYEVARAMRRDAELRSVHLVALTGYALPEDLAKAKEAGFDRHLPKPPSLEKLDEVLAIAGP